MNQSSKKALLQARPEGSRFFEVSILLGSNIEDRDAKIRIAIDSVSALLESPMVSEIIDSPDFTGKGADYLNCLILGSYRPDDCQGQASVESAIKGLTDKLHEIENTLGRDRSTPNVVSADIDLVTIADSSLSSHAQTTIVVSPREYATYIFSQLLGLLNNGNRN